MSWKIKKQPKDIFLDIPNYFEEDFLEVYPDKTAEDFYGYQNDTPLDLEIMHKKEAGQSIQYAGVRRVYIDEEYLNWLRENKAELTEESLNRYMESLTDREVKRLWIKKLKHNWLSMVSYLPVNIMSKNKIEPAASIEITEEIKLNVQKMYKSCIPVEYKDVYVNPCIWHYSVLNETADIRFELTGDSYFANLNEKYNIDTANMNFKRGHYHNYFLPVVHKAFNKSIETRSELEESQKWIFKFTEEDVRSLEGILKRTLPDYYKISMQTRILAFDDIEKYLKYAKKRSQ